MMGCVVYVELSDEEGVVFDVFKELYVPELGFGINYYNYNTNVVPVNTNQSMERYKNIMTLFTLPDNVADRVLELVEAHKVYTSTRENADALLDMIV
jgi:hypothetical protein